MYYESTLVQVVQKVVVHKQFFRQSHCFTYIVGLPAKKIGGGGSRNAGLAVKGIRTNSTKRLKLAKLLYRLADL
jgi:hypothetical protein